MARQHKRSPNDIFLINGSLHNKISCLFVLPWLTSCCLSYLDGETVGLFLCTRLCHVNIEFCQNLLRSNTVLRGEYGRVATANNFLEPEFPPGPRSGVHVSEQNSFLFFLSWVFQSGISGKFEKLSYFGAKSLEFTRILFCL